MTQATFLKLDKTKMAKAIITCKSVHPKARRVTRTTVVVRGRGGDQYTVTLAQPREGLALAMCNCKAGQAGQYCYHLAAAAACPNTILTEGAAQPAPACSICGKPMLGDTDGMDAHWDCLAGIVSPRGRAAATNPAFAAHNARPSWRQLAKQMRERYPAASVLDGRELNWHNAREVSNA